jgi:hypothetical protein
MADGFMRDKLSHALHDGFAFREIHAIMRFAQMGWGNGRSRMVFENAARGRTVAVLVLVVLLLTLLTAPALATERPGLDVYRENAPKVEAFLRDYLRNNWQLAGPHTDDLVGWIVAYSLEKDTDPLLQLARVLKESKGRHYKLNARGEQTVLRGSSSEIGFSQIQPFWIGKTVEGVKITKDMLFDPEGNVQVGILIYKRYDYGDYVAALTHYNNPKSESPSQYAKEINRLYMNMIGRFHGYKYIPTPLASAVGDSILIG